MHSFLTVSVIIPTFNRALALRRCLLSLDDQTFKDFEVLVCDDGSTDNTKSVVMEFDNILLIRYFCDVNFGGPAKPRNTGIKNSIGKYIAFLDSDDWWAPKKLADSVAKLEEGFDLVYHDLYLMKNNDAHPLCWAKTNCRQLSVPVFDDLLFNGNSIPNSSVVVRRDCINLIKFISEDRQLIAAEDYDTWLRLALFTNKFIRLPGCLGFYSIGHPSITSADRSISNTKFLLSKYSQHLAASSRSHLAWACYRLGRAYLSKNNYILAFIYLIKVCFVRSSLKLKLRSILSILILPLSVILGYFRKL